MAFKFNPFTGNFDIVNASTGTSAWIKDNDTASASSTLIYDVVALTSFNHLEYVINYEDTSNNRKSLSLSVINDNGSIKEKVFGKIGSNLDIDLETDIDSGNFRLKFVNNEVFDIDVSTARLTLT